MQGHRRNKKTHFNVTSELFVCRGSKLPLHTLPLQIPPPPPTYWRYPPATPPTFQGEWRKLELAWIRCREWQTVIFSAFFISNCISNQLHSNLTIFQRPSLGKHKAAFHTWLFLINVIQEYSTRNLFNFTQSAPVGVKGGCKDFVVCFHVEHRGCGSLGFIHIWKKQNIFIETSTTTPSASSISPLSICMMSILYNAPLL